METFFGWIYFFKNIFQNRSGPIANASSEAESAKTCFVPFCEVGSVEPWGPKKGPAYFWIFLVHFLDFFGLFWVIFDRKKAITSSKLVKFRCQRCQNDQGTIWDAYKHIWRYFEHLRKNIFSPLKKLPFWSLFGRKPKVCGLFWPIFSQGVITFFYFSKKVLGGRKKFPRSSRTL